MMRKLALLIADPDVSDAEQARIAGLLRAYFPDLELSVSVGDMASLVPAEATPGTEVLVVASPGARLPARETLPKVLGAARLLAVDSRAAFGRYRVLDEDGKVYTDVSDRHAFEFISSDVPKGYIYFPYGYQYRMRGHGPLDEFGHRISQDWHDLADRDPDTYLILTYGGSTTWSIDCLPDETWTSALNTMLSARARDLGLSRKFLCLNFGQVGYSVLSQMQSYMLFGTRLRPDLVISHDGWNDLLYGTYTDPHLLRRHDIVYPCDLEPWAQALHNAVDKQTVKTRQVPYQLRSPASMVLKSYIDRKLQFERMVQTDGARFVWGVQPTIVDKRSPAPSERDFLQPDSPANKDNWRHVRKRVPELLRSAATAITGTDRCVVDCGPWMADAPASEQHFTDTIHMTPAGDRMVAQAYFKVLAPELGM